jgi:hypothetical protein
MNMNHLELELLKEDIVDYVSKKIKLLEFTSVGQIKIHWDSKDVYYEFSVYPQKETNESI